MQLLVTDGMYTPSVGITAIKSNLENGMEAGRAAGSRAGDGVTRVEGWCLPWHGGESEDCGPVPRGPS